MSAKPLPSLLPNESDYQSREALDYLETLPVAANDLTSPDPARSIIVEAAELHAMITGRCPGAADIQVIDLSSAEQYAMEHIPGAIHFDYDHLVTGDKPATGQLPSLEAIQEQLEFAGISSARPMVVYDGEGTGKAARFCWTMDVLGFENWSLLNGGIDAWDNDERPLSTESSVSPRARFEITDCRDTRLATIDDMLNFVNHERIGILDARTPAEHAGEDVRAERGGHIPGSRNLNWLDTMDPLDFGRLKDPEVLQQMLNELGLTPEHEVVAYCQTHHRSSLSYVMLKWLGYRHIRGYAGSWSEWGNRSDTPVSIGV